MSAWCTQEISKLRVNGDASQPHFINMARVPQCDQPASACVAAGVQAFPDLVQLASSLLPNVCSNQRSEAQRGYHTFRL
jgi:hypothetical protein